MPPTLVLLASHLHAFSPPSLWLFRISRIRRSSSPTAVIYVVDSSDHTRLGLSRSELHSLLGEEELRNSKLLIFANKQDIPGAATAAEITEKLGLTDLKDREWTIIKSVATKGEGLDEGMDW